MPFKFKRRTHARTGGKDAPVFGTDEYGRRYFIISGGLPPKREAGATDEEYEAACEAQKKPHRAYPANAVRPSYYTRPEADAATITDRTSDF